MRSFERIYSERRPAGAQPERDVAFSAQTRALRAGPAARKTCQQGSCSCSATFCAFRTYLELSFREIFLPRTRTPEDPVPAALVTAEAISALTAAMAALIESLVGEY